MKSHTIEDIAERRLAYIQHLQKEVKELDETIHRMEAQFKFVVDENIQLRRIINEIGSLLKAPSINEEPKEEEQ